MGCGKSTISESLAKELDAKYIAVDRVLDEFNLTGDKEDGYISQKSFFKVNEIIKKRAEKILKKGMPVIFDGNFYWKSVVDDLVKKLKFQHYIFTLKAPVETCIARDKEREKTHGAGAARAVYKKSTSFKIGTIINTENKTINQTIKEIKTKLK